jgi:hypothetical protein
MYVIYQLCVVRKLSTDKPYASIATLPHPEESAAKILFSLKLARRL